MFRSLPGSTVFYPYDAVSTERAVELAANTQGITFIRVSRPATNVFYDNDEVFEVRYSHLKFDLGLSWGSEIQTSSYSGGSKT